MNERDFEKCEVFLYAWRHGKKIGGKAYEMLALILRNRVMAGWAFEKGGGYLALRQHQDLRRFQAPQRSLL